MLPRLFVFHRVRANWPRLAGLGESRFLGLALAGTAGCAAAGALVRCDSSFSTCSASTLAASLPSLPSLPTLFCKTRLSEKLASIHEAEGKVLDLMGTPYETHDVIVQLDVKNKAFRSETEYTIHTVVVGMEHRDKPPIVLIHGFMMGAPGFFKLLPLLAKHRTVYAVDIIGMGGSGRPPFDARSSTAAEAERLLVEPFEQWSASMGLTSFVLLGHSFGGFVAACWASRQPASVTSLGLLSPLLGFSDERIDAFKPKQDATWQQQAFYCLVETAWSNHLTPQTLMRYTPGAKSWFARMSKRRFSPEGWVKDMTEEEGRLLTDYLVKTIDTPSSTESTATVCFGPLMRPVEIDGDTIKKRVAALAMPVFAIYGDRDWMDAASPHEIPKCDFVKLASSGHHLYLDNPSQLAVDILQRL